MNTKFNKFQTPWNKGKTLTKSQRGGRAKLKFDIEECKKLYKLGLSLNQIASKMKVSRNTIARRLDELNFKRRNRSQFISLFMNRATVKIKFAEIYKARWEKKDERKRMSEIQKNLPEEVKLARIKKARLIQGRNSKNKIESQVEQLTKDFDFKYVGDGKFFIKRFNPDFVNVDRKLIIEVFGDYWHNLSRSEERDKRRLYEYKNAGFRTLIIWEHELKDLNVVALKIKEFIL